LAPRQRVGNASTAIRKINILLNISFLPDIKFLSRGR